MSKLSSDEIIKKYTEEKKVFPDDDSAIEFMEDISDSLVKDDSKDEEIKRLQEENSHLQEKVDEVTTKYKERFLTSDEIQRKMERVEEPKSEPELKNIIDIKEI